MPSAGAVEERLAACITSASAATSSRARPSAAARRHIVGASAAIAGYTGASPIAPSRGASARERPQRAAARQQQRQWRPRPATITSAVPADECRGRPASPAPPQRSRARPGAAAAPPPARRASGDRERRNRRRGAQGRTRKQHERRRRTRRPPPASAACGRRAQAAAGSVDQPEPLLRGGLHQAALLGQPRRPHAPAHALRRTSSDGRRSGRASAARRRSPDRGARGRSRRWEPSDGRRRPRLRAVAAGAPAAHRVGRPSSPRRAQRERVEVGRRGHALALRLLGRHVGERADDVARARKRVARSRGARRRSRSASRSRPPGARASAATITFCGFTSRWTTPCAWACSSASQSAIPIRGTSRSDSPPPRSSSASVRPRTSSETRYDAPVVAAELVERHDAGWFEPRRHARLALGAGRRGPVLLDRDHLHRDVALEPLVARAATRRRSRRRPAGAPTGSGPARIHRQEPSRWRV